MQIVIALVIVIIAVALLLYKINGEFEKKELIILSAIMGVLIFGYIVYEKYTDAYLPNMFKQKYEKEYGDSIHKLSYELLNNRFVSSKNKFIYKFTFIVEKDGEQFICVAPNVQIQKVENEFVFVDFSNIQKECQKK